MLLDRAVQRLFTICSLYSAALVRFTERRGSMTKKTWRLVPAIAAAYILSALAVTGICLLFREFAVLIVIAYVLAVIVSIPMLIRSLKNREKKRVLKKLRYMSEIMKDINAMVILWDADFHFIEVNEKLTSMTGYTADDLRHNVKNLEKLLPPDAFAPSLQAIVNNKEEEFYVTTQKGAKICTVWNTSMLSIFKGDLRTSYIMMSIGLDLSEAAKIKEDLLLYSENLALSERRFHMASELSEIGFILKEEGEYKFFISEQLQKMAGHGCESNVTADTIKSFIYPKDLIHFENMINLMTSSKASDKNTVHEAEFRMLSSDDSYHWYQLRYKVTPADSFVNSGVGGSIIDISADKEKDMLIEKMAYIDDVTQIYNRNRFMMIGQETMESADFTDSTSNYWVIVFDIDDFHIINDTCGYNIGDRLLKSFAALVLKYSTYDGYGARIGGDNFSMLIKDNGDEELPVSIIKNIQEELAFLSVETYHQGVTCSAGYCRMTDGGDNFSQVLDRAEFSLSMRDGKNSITRYDSKVHDKIIQSNTIEKELANAIDNHELVLYYQPKINLSDGSLMGMEALIRWIKPDGTIVPPASFIPVAENSLLITRISEFVLGEACRQNKKWQDKGYPPVTVSINLTAVDFYQTDVTASIKHALDESGLDAKWLDVELTESLALKDIEHAVKQMEEIKALGVKLSMDDFGTGYSSLSYIQILPITLLKLDRSFVMYLEEDEISREIVSAVIRIAKSKKIETIAEGIETEGQVEILKQSGCDHAQGYFFGKPMPAPQFEQFMASRADRVKTV